MNKLKQKLGDVMKDKSIIKYIEQLIEEEQNMYSKEDIENKERDRLNKIKVELDQCWDLLRQRRALRNAGKNPDDAKTRDSDTVENYKQ